MEFCVSYASQNCHAECLCVLHPYPIFILVICSNLFVSIYSQSELKTVLILIRLLRPGSTVFSNRVNPGSEERGLNDFWEL